MIFRNLKGDFANDKNFTPSSLKDDFKLLSLEDKVNVIYEDAITCPSKIGEIYLRIENAEVKEKLNKLIIALDFAELDYDDFIEKITDLTAILSQYCIAMYEAANIGLSIMKARINTKLNTFNFDVKDYIKVLLTNIERNSSAKIGEATEPKAAEPKNNNSSAKGTNPKKAEDTNKHKGSKPKADETKDKSKKEAANPDPVEKEKNNASPEVILSSGAATVNNVIPMLPAPNLMDPQIQQNMMHNQNLMNQQLQQILQQQTQNIINMQQDSGVTPGKLVQKINENEKKHKEEIVEDSRVTWLKTYVKFIKGKMSNLPFQSVINIFDTFTNPDVINFSNNCGIVTPSPESVDKTFWNQVEEYNFDKTKYDYAFAAKSYLYPNMYIILVMNSTNNNAYIDMVDSKLITK